MLKIGIIITNLGPGGAERIATIQADYLQAHGYNISLITLQDSDDHYHHSKEVTRIRLPRDNAVELYSLVDTLELELIIDHIHWSEHHYAFFELLAANEKKFIIFDHASYFYPLFFDYRVSMFTRRPNIYNLADAVTTLTRHTCALFRLELNNVVVMHNPLSYESDQLSGLTDETVIAVANWLRPEKRLWCVLKTFSLVLKQRSQAKLLLVGPHDSSVNSLCTEYGIPSQTVDAVGSQEQIEPYYLRSSVYLLTSEVEGFGLVLTEASMHGLPRVIMDVPGLEDIVTDGEDGFIVPDADCQAAADKISMLLADQELRHAMGAHARKHSAQFSLESIGKRWQWLIEEVVNSDASIRLKRFEVDCVQLGVDQVSRKAMLNDFKRQLYTFANANKQAIAEVPDRELTRLALMNYRTSMSNDPIGTLLSMPIRFWQKLKSWIIARRIEKSGLFDRKWYLEQNPDVAVARKKPLMHYLFSGVWEGRAPCPGFDGWDYLLRHRDVAASGLDPFFHYVWYGQSEGRLSINVLESLESCEDVLRLPRENNALSLEDWLVRYLNHSPHGDAEVVVLHPDWRGIRASTSQFTRAEQLLFLKDNISESTITAIAAALHEAGVKRVLFQGFTTSWQSLARGLKTVAPEIKLYCIFHGSFYQMGQDYDRRQLTAILKLQKMGILERIGLVKYGMSETLKAAGYATGFVMNYLEKIPDGPAPYPHGIPFKVGIWGREWDSTKPLYPSLAACCHFQNVRPLVYGGGAASQELLTAFKLAGEIRKEVPQPKMPRVLREMYINMNVSLSECAPMLPLESLSVGVPCLISDNNHYFDDHSYLHRMLVVSQPDSDYDIMKKLRAAMEWRDDIIQAYIEYAPGYIARAKQSYTEFLNR
jgi:glycosyltransferase involved in cell wall biosynthesis